MSVCWFCKKKLSATAAKLNILFWLFNKINDFRALLEGRVEQEKHKFIACIIDESRITLGWVDQELHDILFVKWETSGAIKKGWW